jgi:DNA-binding response OmpR family regulator
VVSESSALATKLQAFRDGADDYLVKPLSPAEVELRIGNRILRSKRKPDSKIPPLQVGDLVMDRDTRRVERAGVALKLTPTLFRVLELLMVASPDVVSRRDLLRELWREQLPQSDSLRSHLYALRKQVNVRSLPPLMHTVRTTGVRLAMLAVATSKDDSSVPLLRTVTVQLREAC